MKQEAKNEVAALAKRLPMKLRAGLNVRVLAAAMEENLMELRADGTLEWKQSKTLLAYLAGRACCGDVPMKTHAHTYVWKTGSVRFPEKDLTTVFGMRNLRELRKQCAMVALPTGWEIIDEILELV